MSREIMLPVGAPLLAITVAAGWAFSAFYEERLQREAQGSVQHSLRSLRQALELTDHTVGSLVRGSMKVLQAEVGRRGPPSLGAPVTVAGAAVPGLELGGVPVGRDHDVVDSVAAKLGGTATLFTRSGDGFIRVSTNVKKDDGARAVGTPLDPRGKAIARLRVGEGFEGLVDILGSPYLTSYQPITDAAGRTIGAHYVGYKLTSLERVAKTISETRILEHGFVVLEGAAKKVLFRTAGVTDESVAEALGPHSAEAWVVERAPFEPWGFTIVAAYPRSDVTTPVWRARGLVAAAALPCLLFMWVAVFLVVRRTVLRPLADFGTVLGEVAAGDLRADAPTVHTNEVGELGRLLNAMIATLRQTMGEIQGVARSVVKATAAISQGNGELARRTESQAASLEETASSLAQLTATVRSTAIGAQSVATATGQAEAAAEGGRARVLELVAAMGQITTSSSRIAEVVGIVDELSFQTNLLALNASVEAARAGEHGRGFAVVATEVRNLAQRSAGAAKEINALITESVAQARSGQTAATRADEAIAAVVGGVRGATEASQGIAEATAEQSRGLVEINQVVAQMDQTTQRNAAMVQEAAAAAESLDHQAGALAAIVSRFITGSVAAPPPSPGPAVGEPAQPEARAVRARPAEGASRARPERFARAGAAPVPEVSGR